MKKLTALIVALVVVFAALPAFAASSQEADWAFYGQARMWTAWESVNSDAYNLYNILGTAVGGGTSASALKANLGGAFPVPWKDKQGQINGDSDLNWKMGGTARVGANVKWGNVGGTFEFRTTNAPEGGDYFVNLALLYGTWNFGPGTLTVGKDYPPYFYLISNVCGPGAGECSGVNYGSIYTGRRPQLKLTMGGFNFALVQPQGTVTAAPGAAPSTNVAYDVATGAFSVAADTDQYLPNIQASYSTTLGPVGLFVGGLYQTIKQNYSDTTGVFAKSATSYAFGVGGKSAFGPFYLNGTVQYAQNVASSELVASAALLPRYQFIDSTNGWSTENAKYFSAFLVAGFKLTDAIFFEGGASYQNGKVDVPSPGGGDVKQDLWFYYIMMQWSPVKNVFIAPELGYIDATELKVSGRPDVDLGAAWWLGIKWQINF